MSKGGLIMKVNSIYQRKICNYHINKAIKEMNINYYDSLTLKSMANYLGLNKCYFCDLFRKETGKTYSQVLNEIRVEKSLELLLDTNMTILEIALSVGYNNQNYYNMAFKRIMGITPFKYRNRILNNKDIKESVVLP